MRYRSFFNLVFGFLIGQGAMFIAQTLLISKSEVALVGQITIGLGLLTLAQWLADAGGVFLIPRLLGSEENAQKRLACFINARFIFVTIIVISVLVYLITKNSWHLYYGLVSFIIPVLLISSFSVIGYLDFYNETKASGTLSGVSWSLASLPLYYSYFYEGDRYIIGMSAGLLFVLGNALFIIIQCVKMKQVSKNGGIKLMYKDGFCIKKIKYSFYDIIKYNLNYGFSQSYGRLVPILLNTLLGPVLAGYYIYAKSFANIANQFIAFSRRVEFSNLIAIHNGSVRKILSSQLISFGIACIFAIFCFGTELIECFYTLPIGNNTLLYIQIIALINLLWCLSSSFSQYFIAKGKLGFICITQLITYILSLSIIYFGVEYLSIYSVFAAESIMYIVQFLIFIVFLKTYKKL